MVMVRTLDIVITDVAIQKFLVVIIWQVWKSLNQLAKVEVIQFTDVIADKL